MILEIAIDDHLVAHNFDFAAPEENKNNDHFDAFAYEPVPQSTIPVG